MKRVQWRQFRAVGIRDTGQSLTSQQGRKYPRETVEDTRAKQSQGAAGERRAVGKWLGAGAGAGGKRGRADQMPLTTEHESSFVLEFEFSNRPKSRDIRKPPHPLSGGQ